MCFALFEYVLRISHLSWLNFRTFVDDFSLLSYYIVNIKFLNEWARHILHTRT